MAYNKTQWVDGKTPVNATNLNKIEDGIGAIDSGLDTLSQQVLTMQESTQQALNTKLNAENIIQGENVTISKQGNNITISATGGNSGLEQVQVEALISSHNKSGTAHEDIRTSIQNLPTKTYVDGELVKKVNDTDYKAKVLELETKNSSQDLEISKKVSNTVTINGKQLNSNIVLTKSDVGLSNVDNTSDLDKPISTATKAELDTKLNAENIIQGDNITISKVGNNITISATGVTGGGSGSGSGIDQSQVETLISNHNQDGTAHADIRATMDTLAQKSYVDEKLGTKVDYASYNSRISAIESTNASISSELTTKVSMTKFGEEMGKINTEIAKKVSSESFGSAMTSLSQGLVQKLEAGNIVQGQNIILTKDGNNIVISARTISSDENGVKKLTKTSSEYIVRQDIYVNNSAPEIKQWTAQSMSTWVIPIYSGKEYTIIRKGYTGGTGAMFYGTTTEFYMPVATSKTDKVLGACVRTGGLTDTDSATITAQENENYLYICGGMAEYNPELEIVIKGDGEQAVESGGFNLSEWQASQSYSVGDCVTYKKFIYKCKTSNSDELFDKSKWDVLVGDRIVFLSQEEYDSLVSSNQIEEDVLYITKDVESSNPFGISATEVPITTIVGMTATNVQEALEQVFQFSNDAQSTYEATIIGKGGVVSKVGAIPTKSEIVTGIESIPVGVGGDDSKTKEKLLNVLYRLMPNSIKAVNADSTIDEIINQFDLAGGVWILNDDVTCDTQETLFDNLVQAVIKPNAPNTAVEVEFI